MASVLLGATTLAATPALAADINGTDVAVTVGFDYVDEYVFRGLSFADASIQPYVEAGIGNFTIGAWANTPVGDDADLGLDEIDLYASYGLEFSDLVTGSVGITYYHFPEAGGFFGTDGGATGTYEVNAGLSLDYPLAPSITGYYDFTLEAFTLEGSLGYDLATSERSSLGLGVTGGFVQASDGGLDYEYVTASAGWSFSLTDDAALTAGVNYSLNSEDGTLGFSRGTDPTGTRFGFTDDDDLFWSGIGLSAGF